jgi:hypothetical protein
MLVGSVAGSEANDPPRVWNTYAGRLVLHSHGACVPVVFQGSNARKLVRFGIDRRQARAWFSARRIGSVIRGASRLDPVRERHPPAGIKHCRRAKIRNTQLNVRYEESTTQPPFVTVDTNAFASNGEHPERAAVHPVTVSVPKRF